MEDAQTAIRFVHLACRRRSVTHTNMNAASSRGHVIFQVTDEAGTRFCIVDLAGRENERTTQCRGQSLAELSHINKSLFHLTSVIQALARPIPGTIVPFRNSKLTLLLSESLQCARTFLLATVSPVVSSFEETATTLRLAQAVRHITTKTRCERFMELPRSLTCVGVQDRFSGKFEQSSSEGLLPSRPISFAPLLGTCRPHANNSCSPGTSDGRGEARWESFSRNLEQNPSEGLLPSRPISLHHYSALMLQMLIARAEWKQNSSSGALGILFQETWS